MKYYFNIVYNLKLDKQIAGQTGQNRIPLTPRNDDFRFPTAPMYQQDGVYNQLCKYRLVNFQITGMSDAERDSLSESTIIISMRNIPSRNNFNLFNYGTPNFPPPVNGLNVKNGVSPVQFHIRLDDGILQFADKDCPSPNGAFYNMAMKHEVADEVVGNACWGNSIDFDVIKYTGSIDAQAIYFDADMLLTLEVEPIYEKI